MKTIAHWIYNRITTIRDDGRTPKWLVSVIDWIRYELLWELL